MTGGRDEIVNYNMRFEGVEFKNMRDGAVRLLSIVLYKRLECHSILITIHPSYSHSTKSGKLMMLPQFSGLSKIVFLMAAP